jgi:hypothetical protein
MNQFIAENKGFLLLFELWLGGWKQLIAVQPP